MLRDAQQVLSKVCFLAVCGRTIYHRKLVVELLRRLHWLRRVKCMHMRDDWRTREGCRRARAWTEFDCVVMEFLGVMRDPPLLEKSRSSLLCSFGVSLKNGRVMVWL